MNTGTQNSRPIAGVTGASSGIGRALAEQFAKNGFDLVIAAEDENIDAAADELRALGCSVYPVRADLTEEAGVEEFAAALRQYGPPYAVAINAGIGSSGRFAETELEQELRLVDLNCRSVVHLAKRVVQMMNGREGRILVTSSIASLAPGPYEAVYSASKAFDYSFALALRHELQETEISVTALMPGPTETNFFTRAHAEDTKLGQEPKDDPQLGCQTRL